MVRVAAITLVLGLLLATATFGIGTPKQPSITPLTGYTIKGLSAAPSIALAESCLVRHDLGSFWKIDHWLIGAELYKAFQNPSLTCSSPYPFTVHNVNMMMFFNKLCTLYVSVDIESADLSTPSCPKPGNLLTISQEYLYVVNPPSGGGLYQLSVPIDSSVAVNGPYFVGFYISNYIDTLVGASIITDSLPALCTSYNIWDTAVGYIDLCQNSLFNFPGRLVLFSTGTPGGSSGTNPAPAVTLLKPAGNEIVLGSATVWATETAGSNIISYVKFDRKTTGVWTEIGRDHDGSRALRDGVNPSGSGDGYSFPWDYSTLTEGLYWLKATVYDTLGRNAADSHQVAIDPTPPDPTMVNPTFLDTLCLPAKLEVTIPDEDVTQVKFEYKNAPTNYSISFANLPQSKYGDINHNALDGNHAASGEFGDYYCGPVAAAQAVKYWFDMGYNYCMREGASYITVDTVVERLAANMRTRLYKGTYDDLFFGGFIQYMITHGNELEINIVRRPDYAALRNLFQEQELFVILGLSGTPGVYLPINGVAGLSDFQGRYPVSVSNPITGTTVNGFIRNNAGIAQYYLGGVWHDIDVAFTIAGYSQTVSRTLIGTDNSSLGGWTYDWNSSALTGDSLYFITVSATDAAGRIGKSTALVRYGCKAYTKGDYNADGVVNIGDILYLINYIYKGGVAPVGGAARADADCSGSIDIADVIYFIRFIYGQGAGPCR